MHIPACTWLSGSDDAMKFGLVGSNPAYAPGAVVSDIVFFCAIELIC